MQMKKSVIVIFLFTSSHLFSQEKYVERYENGRIHYVGTLINSTYNGAFKEYYMDGILKERGTYKNCNKGSKPIKNNSGYFRKILRGSKDGIWETYYENGEIKTKEHFRCDVLNGSKYIYTTEGKLKTIEFYSYGDLITSHTYNNKGLLESFSLYSYSIDNSLSKKLKTIHECRYYHDGKLKSEHKIEEVISDSGTVIKTENTKEYSEEGVLK
jgi:antitoxin component YwqK of YwqJK toxin-antitoxin module